MHSFEKKINGLIKEKQLFMRDEKVLVGVSAGPDSTALLLVLSRLQQELGLSLVAVYVDHGLRPDETPAEIELLGSLCDELDIRLLVESVDVSHEAATCKESTEQAARKLRYQIFARLAEQFNAGKIAVGHTADDQAEEVLLRLLRGTARAGLSGMKLLRDNCVVRPLLQVTKQDIYSYLKDSEIQFLQDSSNDSSIYLRNQVRQDVLPFLRNYNPSIDANLRNLALILQDEEDLLNQQVQALWNDLVAVNLDVDTGQTVEWDCATFGSLHIAMQRRIAEKMFITMESVPSSDKIKQLLYLICNGQGGGQLHFAHGLRALKIKGQMFFWYPQGKVKRKGNLFEPIKGI